MGKVVQKRHEMESECLGICPDDLCMSVDWYDLIRSKNAAKLCTWVEIIIIVIFIRITRL